MGSEPEGDEGRPAGRLQPLSIEQVLLEPSASDDEAAASGPPPPRPAPRTSGAGPILTAIALGLQEVFDPRPTERTQIEQVAPGEPDEPQRYEVHLDPKNPRNSSAVYRPWVDEPGTP